MFYMRGARGLQMKEIFQIAAFGIISAVLILILKKDRPEYALQIGIVSGVIILFLIVGRISGIIAFIEKLAGDYNIDTEYIGIVIKIICIAYISEFGVQICKDAGENAVAGKMELAGKIIIATLALPVMGALIETLVSILPNP
jgi:stage III sporulation protein AD